MKETTLKKYIGNTYGSLTVLDLDHETYNSETQTKRTYLKCLCNRCGKNTVVRADRFAKNSTYAPVSCAHCVIDRQKETAEKKYQIKNTKTYRSKISSIKHNAKSRNLNINLTDEYMKSLFDSNCHYCNCNKAMGIDRIDSKLDYTIENSVACCGICNIMKNKFDLNIFLDKIKQIYFNFYKEGSTTIPKGSTLQANGSGSGELLNVA